MGGEKFTMGGWAGTQVVAWELFEVCPAEESWSCPWLLEEGRAIGSGDHSGSGPPLETMSGAEIPLLLIDDTLGRCCTLTGLFIESDLRSENENEDLADLPPWVFANPGGWIGGGFWTWVYKSWLTPGPKPPCP